jgi:hypothetical protein
MQEAGREEGEIVQEGAGDDEMSIPSLNVSASNSDDEISDESPLQRGSGGEEHENTKSVCI